MSFYFHKVKILILVLLLGACSTTPPKPDLNSEQYRKAVSNFYLSLAAIQSDQALFAVEKMQEVADAYPPEPAAWANLGVFAMRQGNFELATEQMEKALDRAGQNANIQFLAGILESRKGNIETALEYLKEAARLEPTNVRVLFALVEELEREDPKGNARQIKELLDQILQRDPHNLAVLLETVRTAAKWEKRSALEKALKDLEALSDNWPDQIKRQFQDQKWAILEKKGENITFELAFLRNNLNQLSQFQHDLQQVQLPPNQVGFLITEFLWLPNSENRAAPLDEKLTFTSEEMQEKKKVQLYKPISLADGRRAKTISIFGSTAFLDNSNLKFPGNGEGEFLHPQVVTTLDYNYDFLNDIVFAGPGGFKFYKQREDSTFEDITESLQVPSSITSNSFVGAWADDLDMDGDLDLLLSATDGSCPVLRNNGDGTFAVQSKFFNSQHIRDFLWADFDSDGDPDAVILTRDGQVLYYSNKRAGELQRDTTFSIQRPVRAIDFGDLNSDGIFEVVSWQKDRISSTRYVNSTGSWKTSDLIMFENVTDYGSVHPQLFIADLDNNGALDLMISDEKSTKFWLGDQNITLVSDPHELASYVYGLSDVNSDNRLDLFGITGQKLKSVMINSGSKDYNAKIISPRASGPSGDRRINSFGIGGEVESRSGLQYLKQPISKPWVHLGLGTYKEAEMVRIIWPNGSVQAEFAELGYDSRIMNEQILKGSCPWVFTYNGEEMEFVTDFLWKTALGLKINAQGKSSVLHSIDWIKVEGGQLKPRNGYYDVRITADLWETHFFDHVSLMAVDHPQNTEIFVDERFILPAVEQKLYPIKEIYPIASATDQDGNDVTQEVASNDGTYVDSFSLTPYQGLAKEHFIEVDLGSKVPRKGKLKLIASGWIYPTDTSINYAISQGDHNALHGIRLEVHDSKGGWKVVHKDIGFPSGKNKTILINLENIFESGTEHKVRLYTNMEIYWDQIRVGLQDNEIPLISQKVSARVAKLRYRGFSRLQQTDRFSPTVPDYQTLAGTTPKWRNLVGFYTRFGDVQELTQKIDDRYVIMNSGDELLFKFPALDAPKDGWTRDFVLIGDGWIKDGDYNTIHSKHVIPLPYHGMEDYSVEPGLLIDDPVYQKHKKDWAEYHTRYITQKDFNMALQFKK